MSTLMKKERKQVRFYISEQAAAKLEQLKSTTGQTDVWIVDTILAAGLDAVTEQGRLTLPLRFQLEGEAEQRRAREAPLPKRKAA